MDSGSYHLTVTTPSTPLHAGQLVGGCTFAVKVQILPGG